MANIKFFADKHTDKQTTDQHTRQKLYAPNLLMRGA